MLSIKIIMSNENKMYINNINISLKANNARKEKVNNCLGVIRLWGFVFYYLYPTEQLFAHFFCKGPESQYFQLCKLYGVLLLLKSTVVQNNHKQYINK